MGVDATVLGAVSGPPLTSVAFDAETVVDVSVAAMMAEYGRRRDELCAAATSVQRVSSSCERPRPATSKR